ncbi:MAG: acyl-CoA dehydrogenase family protein [Candidatus Sericytochromatia bacterium]|nr:acyl-CoA dehydrogenase family protein [Candidatus Sericytochromatia bacterium]
MDYGLTDDQRAIQRLARDFAQDIVAPLADSLDSDGVFRRDLFERAASLGLASVPLSADWGGGGADYLTYLLVIEALAQASMAVAGPISVHTLCQFPIAAYGTDDQRRAILPKMATGEWLAAFALTEPNAGSDTAALETSASKVDGGYLLNGTKVFITNGGDAEITIVMARTSPEGGKGITAFLVPKDTAGFGIGKKERTLGNRGTSTRELIFTDCFVPDSARLGPEGAGQRVALSALAKGRVSVAAGSVGVAQAAIDHACRHLKQRKQFGQRLAEFQGLQFMVADMATQTEAARALVYATGRMIDAGQSAVTEASMAKLFATDMAMKVTTDAVQLFGGYGFSEEYPVARLFRDAKGAQIYEGTNQIQRVLIARDFLGKD